ncbi:MAG TPA: Hpt domain-containing protein [Fibrobacteria bacterium]|nr:Hpt domain-containing protein [Fibrobacteria bacterium]
MLAPLAAIASEIAAPAAMRTMAKRLGGSVQSMVDGESSMDDGVVRLAQGVDKLQHSFESIGPNPLLDVPLPESDESESPASDGDNMFDVPLDSIPEHPEPISVHDPEDLDLLKRFIDRQKGELEEFEVAVIEREKGDGTGDDHVKRYLHTLKGEFGVLDLAEWAELIHAVESLLETGGIGTEGLLRLKDLIEERLPSMNSRHGRIVSPEDVARVLERKERPAPEVAQAIADEAPSEEPVSSFGLDTSFLVDFIAEGGDHIRVIEKSLLKLEVTPTDEESLNLVFRSCHTLKGLAGFLELKEIQRLAHAAENLMDRARNKQIVLRPQHVDVLLETTDMFRGLVDGLEKMLGGEAYTPPREIEDVIAKLRESDSLDPLPKLQPTEAAKPMGEILVERGLVEQDVLDQALQTQKAGDTRPLGEILIETQGVNPRDVAQVLGQKVEASRPQPPPPPAQASSGAMAVEESVRVPVQRLDMLIDTIGEAVIAQSMVWADPAFKAAGDLSTEKKIAQASLILRQIQELSMSLRMVSIRSTFQKMARLVRDLARKLDKQIELDMEGEDTELDKTVVENIGDPLIHMVRNSVDHGIETPAERRAAGKPPEGRVRLRAYHKAGSVFIEIEDDGKGLDKDAILKKAIASGKARAEQAYTDQEIYQMVFLPGLSTAKAVTDVSGRGVGMDVVKKNIEALRGMVEIRSEKGKGTCFTIRLPLTLAIIQGMVVRANDERYIVPTLSILSTLRLESQEIQSVVGKGEILNLRGELIRLIRLDSVFGKNTIVDEGSGGVVLVVEDMVGRKVGLVVDQILEQQQVVIKRLGAGIGDVPGVSGGAIMNDGSVSLILDVGGVVKIASESN